MKERTKKRRKEEGEEKNKIRKYMRNLTLQIPDFL
jgi:hypothetical protein